MSPREMIDPQFSSQVSSAVPLRANNTYARRLFLVGVLSIAGLSSGCHFNKQATTLRRPSRHSVQADQLLLLSDFKLDKDHPLFQDLVELREQVSEILNLPLNNNKVMVFLFSDETKYRQYMQATYPGLPSRRAYFVGSADELAVYTFWGDRIQEDLRHEFTHGLLHAVLKDVPLWLDEGLAEYFEVIGPDPGQINLDYARRLTTAIGNGWRPNMQRLEKLKQVSQMQRVDYQEAWAWVHFMLHGSPEAKTTLLGYLHDLKTTSTPGSLSDRLHDDIPELDTRFLSYLASLNSLGHQAASY